MDRTELLSTIDCLLLRFVCRFGGEGSAIARRSGFVTARQRLASCYEGEIMLTIVAFQGLTVAS